MMKFLLSKYNFDNPSIKKLVGYDVVNYKIQDKNKKYILKVYPDEKEEVDLAAAENMILNHLRKRGASCFPVPVPNSDDELLTVYDENNTVKVGRLLTFLEGEFLSDVEHNFALFGSLGNFLAQMDLRLRDFKNYVIEARKLKWDLQHLDLNRNYLKYIADPGDRKIAKYYFQQYDINVLPVIHFLRKQIIHGDANEWNTLTDKNRISGLIDFGDVCFSQLINELAISLAYALMNKDNPVQWAVPVISEYNKVIPLEENEIDILYWLIAARLCSSVCNSAYEKFQRPENEYIQISEKPAWDLLKKWVTINPVYARNVFREAAGMKIPIEKPVEVINEERLKWVSPIFSVSYKKPIYMERAAFQYMFDKYGNSYLDAYNNIPHVGHSHPVVVEAGQKQLARLNTNTRYLYDELNQYTENLLRYFPIPLNKVYLVNSGSAAADLAIRMARNFTCKKRIASLEHGYHGNMQSLIEISHYKFAGKGGAGATENVLCLPVPDIYRGHFRDDRAGLNYARNAIHQINNSSDPIAAFIAEPIVGCGGQIPLAKNYLNEIYPAIRKQGGVCISDEVQTGFGRLGDVFWGYEMYNVIPDIVVLGKPMGNGHPIGAVVTTDEIAQAFDNGMEFFSSFGGNPVSCAIGQAVLNVLEDERLPENAKTVGDYYIKELIKLKLKYDCIGDVRGSGLFIGFEFVKDRETLIPDTLLAQRVKNELRNMHILVSTDGPFENVIKSKPPLCFSEQNVDQVISAIDLILGSSDII